MGIGRFHAICDHCGSKSDEYSRHVEMCKDCQDEVCEACSADGDYESGPDNWALCKRCAVPMLMVRAQTNLWNALFKALERT